MRSEIADFKSTMLNNYLTSLYFYLIPRNEINEETTVSMGYISNKITNICFNPFISSSFIIENFFKVSLNFGCGLKIQVVSGCFSAREAKKHPHTHLLKT